MTTPAASPILEAARAMAAVLVAAGVTAVTDARAALGNLPCVLVPPPRVEFGGYGHATARWRLVAIASVPLGNEDAWGQLDAMLAMVAAVLPAEAADPTQFPLPTGGDPLPAYAITVTGSVAL